MEFVAKAKNEQSFTFSQSWQVFRLLSSTTDIKISKHARSSNKLVVGVGVINGENHNNNYIVTSLLLHALWGTYAGLSIIQCHNIIPCLTLQYNQESQRSFLFRQVVETSPSSIRKPSLPQRACYHKLTDSKLL